MGINIRDIDLGTYVANLQKDIKMKAEIPSGYFIDTVELSKTSAGHAAFAVVVPLSIFIIIGLLYLILGK